jgi:hypothetical protein
MNARGDADAYRVPLADLCALGTLFVFSRVPWVVAFFYYSDERAMAFAGVTLLIAGMLVLAIGALFAWVRLSTAGWLARTAVLAMFLYFVAGFLRQTFAPGAVISTALLAAIAAGGVVLAAAGAARLTHVWPRLRSAMIAAAVICTTSVFVLAAVLAPDIRLFADSQPGHRPVVVLLLDEFSAGAARDIVADLARHDLDVDDTAVPSVGTNTIDAIPAMMAGMHLGDARPCTHSAVCGRGRVLDFGRLSMGREDVDIIGVYHPYCAIGGLRHCVIPMRGLEGPVWSAYLCGLPLRLVLRDWLDCERPGYVPPTDREITAATRRDLFAAPFWSQGGLLYAHLLVPHPPSPSGERRLADAYAANVVRARELVEAVVAALERTPFRGDYSLIVTSDHHLRSEYWCAIEPYVDEDCALPESMRDSRVPFIVASRGGAVAYGAPRSNGDLQRIVAELSRPR